MEFLIDTGSEVIYIEVKAKSPKIFRGKYRFKAVIRKYMMDYKQEDWLLNLPL